MRSQKNFQIDASKFRHYGAFNVLETTKGLVDTKSTIKTLNVWFSYLGGSGLTMGDELFQSLQTETWKTISEENKIIFRFQELLNEIKEPEKDLQFSFKSSDFSVTAVVDVWGESIYQMAEIEKVNQ